MRQVDELILLCIDDSNQVESLVRALAEISELCSVPLSVGGGVSSVNHVDTLLRYGADKVVVNSSLYRHKHRLSDMAERFGSQALVASVDTLWNGREFITYSNHGRLNEGRELGQWCRELEDRGAGEILVTSIAKDGEMKGYDLAAVRRVTASVSIPVLVGGGAGQRQHFQEAAMIDGVSGLCASSAFHFTPLTPRDVKDHLASMNFFINI